MTTVMCFVLYLDQELIQHKTSYFDMGEPYVYIYFFLAYAWNSPSVKWMQAAAISGVKVAIFVA